MSSRQNSLPSFLRAESLSFLKLSGGMTLFVGVISLPAAVVILSLLPEALGYLAVTMGSLVLIMTGTWDGSSESDDGDDGESLGFETPREMLIVSAILYAVLAGAFSLLLVASAGLGYAITQSGYPTIGIAVAFGLSFVDNRLARVDSRLSIVNLSGAAVGWLLRALLVLYSVPSSLVSQVNRHRRQLY